MAKKTEPTPDAAAALEAELHDLALRAQRGDRAALPALRQLLNERPQIWQRFGDLAAEAQTAWLDVIAGPDLLLRESLARRLAELRVDLSGTAPTLIEGLVIGRVIACWLQVHYADATYARAPDGPAAATARRELERRMTSSQHRYLALKQLAMVRKPLRPGLTLDAVMGKPTPTAPPVATRADGRPAFSVVGAN